MPSHQIFEGKFQPISNVSKGLTYIFFRSICIEDEDTFTCCNIITLATFQNLLYKNIHRRTAKTNDNFVAEISYVPSLVQSFTKTLTIYLFILVVHTEFSWRLSGFKGVSSRRNFRPPTDKLICVRIGFCKSEYFNSA